jgi:hypothetical protein
LLNVQEIRDFHQYQTKTRHNLKLGEQQIDQTFWDDTYLLPLVKKPDYILRTGFVAEMINGITQLLIGDNPKLYVTSRKDTDASKKASSRIASEGNRFLKILLRDKFSPYRESFKKFNIRGEAWIYTPHNELCAKWNGNDSWYDKYPDLLPVQFISYDPMVVFADPNEEVDGTPVRVVLSYERTAGELKSKYPNWNRKPHQDTQSTDNDKVKFMFYIDKEQMYAEADEVEIFHRPNIYGFVPLTHSFAGFGIETVDKDPSKMALSRIGMVRDGIVEESTIRSDIYFNMHRYAHKFRTLYLPAGTETNKDAFASYMENPDGINEVKLPQGTDPSWFKVDETQEFSPQVYAYADRVFARQTMMYPLALRGAGGGSSGRQDDLSTSSGLAIYQCVVENNNLLWARAMDNAFKVMFKVPNLRTPNLQEGDNNSYSEISVDLKRDDLVDRDRKIGNGRISVTQGQRSLRTHLIKDYGMTAEDADDEIDNILAERIMFQSPDIAAFLGFKAAEKSGMADELNAYKQAEVDKKVNPAKIEMGSAIGSKGGEPRQGNIKTQTGAEMPDVSNSSYGVRSPANA